MSHHSRRIRAGCLSLLLFMLLSATPLPSGAINRSGAAEAQVAEHPVRKIVAQRGRARVIITLAETTSPEGMLSGSQSFAQRSRIAAAQDQLVTALAPFKAEVGRRFTYIPALVAVIDIAALDFLLASPLVRLVEEDKLAAPHLDESIPIVDADQLHDLDEIGSNRVVAVLDTGVDTAHSFLTGKIVAEACFSSNINIRNASSVCPNGQTTQIGTGSARPCSMINCEHGTHVAGIVAGGTAGRAAAPSSGVAPGAKIIAIQVFTRMSDDTPTSGETPCADIGYPSPCSLSFGSDQLAAMEHVFTLRTSFNIAAINMSLGTAAQITNCDSTGMKTKIDNLLSVGIATVASAGNSSKRNAMGSPACVSSAVSVAATTNTDTIADFSNIASFTTLIAPGVEIYSAYGSSFAQVSGTSQAAPHVAGAIALLKSAEPTAPITEVIRALRDTGPLIRDTRPDGTVSKRRLNVRQALTALGSVDSDDFRVVRFGSSLAGTISPSTDQDIMYFDATGGQRATLRASKTGTSTVDTFISLFAPDGRLMVSDDNGSGGTDALINLFDLPDTGRYRVRVSSRASTSGSYSLSVSGTASSTNPVPRIRYLTPGSTALSPSTTSITFKVVGYNFVPGSVVRINTTNLPTTFQGTTQLSALLTRDQLDGTGSYAIRVFNPTPGGGLSNAQTFTVETSTVGESELSPPEGASTIGVTTTYVLTWTHPVRWRDLSYLDLRLRSADGFVPLWVRFTEGSTSTMYLLNGAGEMIARGTPGTAGVLESEMVKLSLADSRVVGTGADGPSVTLVLSVAFKAPAMGHYAMELLAGDNSGAAQGPDTIGSWTVLGTHAAYLPALIRSP